MMSLESIRQIEADARGKAAKLNTQPFLTWAGDEQLGASLFGSFPFIGTFIPKGWVRKEAYFVDASGLGRNDEPALTVDEMLQVVQSNIGSGWAIVEAGQFQVIVARYERKPKARGAKSSLVHSTIGGFEYRRKLKEVNAS